MFDLHQHRLPHDDRLFRYLSGIPGSPVTCNNKVDIATNAEQLYSMTYHCMDLAEKHIHIEFYIALMTVTATCDIEPERARIAAELIGANIVVTDYSELLDKVDAVLIALPHDLHFSVGMACLQAGKHVLMEKPLCNSEEECLQLIETAEKNKLIIAMDIVLHVTDEAIPNILILIF